MSPNHQSLKGRFIWATILISSLLLGDARGDQYFWVGSGAWSDVNNWNVPTNPANDLPPDGDDEVRFGQSSSINLDLETGVMVLDFDVGEYTLQLAGNSIGVGGANLFHVGSSGDATLDVTGGTISANGTLLGATAAGDGTLNIAAGATLDDGNQISVGYTGMGELHLTGGGRAQSAGAIFIGGFETGVGTVGVTGEGSELAANDSFLAVGNLGGGTLNVQSGGSVSAFQLILGGFPSGTGEAFIAGDGDATSMISATTSIDVGSFGYGRIFVENGGRLTADKVTVGNAQGADGGLYLSGSTAVVDIGDLGLFVGPSGRGAAAAADGARVNVAAGAGVQVGGQASGEGVLGIRGSNSKLAAADSSVSVGALGHGELTVSEQGQANVKNIRIGGASTSQAQVSVESAGQLSVAQSVYVDGGQQSELKVTTGGKLSLNVLQVGIAGTGPSATVIVKDTGSTLNATTGIYIGSSTGMASAMISSGGLIHTPRVDLALENGTSGSLTLDGANSRLDVEYFDVGVRGHGELTVQNGAALNIPNRSIVGVLNGAQATVRVAGNASTLQFNGGVDMGFVGTDGNATASVTATSGGRIAISAGARLDYGKMTTEGGGAIQVNSSLHMSSALNSVTEIDVRDANSSFAVEGTAFLGPDGKTTIDVQGGAFTAQRITRIAPQSAQSTATSTIRVSGGGSTLTADSLQMLESTDSLQVIAGGHAWFRRSLELGHSALDLNGGSIDVGFLFGAPKANTIRIGPGALFGYDGAAPSIENTLGFVHVGGSPGTLAVSGNFTQDAGGVVSFSIAGTDPGADYSQLIVGGDLNLQGTVRISFQDGFVPLPGQTFDLITVAGAISLSNYHVEIGNLAGFSFSFAPVAGGMRLTALSSAQFLPPTAGDFDRDGFVDGADLTRWQANFGTANGATPSQGDANGDMAIDGADFLVWQRQLAVAASGVSADAPVPEPATSFLFIVSAAGILVRRHRMRQ